MKEMWELVCLRSEVAARVSTSLSRNPVVHPLAINLRHLGAGPGRLKARVHSLACRCWRPMTCQVSQCALPPGESSAISQWNSESSMSTRPEELLDWISEADDAEAIQLARM